MLRKKLVMILSTALVFAVLIGAAALFFAGGREVPDWDFSAPPALEPDVIFGSGGENKLPEEMSGTETSEDPETTKEPDKDIEQTPEGIPETPKEEPSENETPNTEKITDETGGESAGEGSGDVTGEGEPGETVIVTDLENRIVTSGEIEEDIFSFFAYIENGKESHSLSVNFRNSETSFSGEYLEGAGDYYEAKLALGANYFTLYLEEEGKAVSSFQYIITYQADKAGASNPDVGEGVSIVTNLDDFDEVLENKYFTFTVTARSSGKVIYSDHIEVTLDGTVVDDPTGSTTFEYVLNFGPEETHIVTVLAWDDEGNSAYREYEVKFKSINDGDAIGYATVVIDATTAGLGIIGECEVEILQGDTAAKTLVTAADYMGVSVHYDGSTEGGMGFYVRGISGYAGTPEVPPELWEYILRDGLSITSSPSGGLFAGDFTANSGWMYSINGTLYPGKGLAAYNLSDGDVLYLRFTVAEGKDIGGSGGGNGSLSGYCGIWSDGGYYELDHEYAEINRTEPTATENGYVEYECDICKKTYTEELPATGEEEHIHDYYEVYREEPTETEEGYVEYECSCGDFYQETLPATGTGKEDEETEEEGGETP